ncbi:MAG: hypothetical protein QOD33_639 [Pyrinomonadaceae bacterium]|nr:hypothetical protein [Pyrinomonadaceae bacterium]
MKNLFVAIVLLVFNAALAFSVQEPAGWITYTSPEGHYTVSLPLQPKTKTQESATADGEKFTQYLATSSDARTVFMIGFFDVVPGTVFSATVARDAMVKSVSGKLISDDAITLGVSPGHDLNIALKLPTGEPPADEEYVDRARIYEVEKRVYILQVIFPKSLEGAEQGAKVSRFFDSFQMVKN